MIVDAYVWLYTDVGMGRQGVPSSMRVGAHMDGVDVLFSLSDLSVKHWDGTWSSPVKMRSLRN